MTNGLYFFVKGYGLDGDWLRTETVFVAEGSTLTHAETVYEERVSSTGPAVAA